MLRLLIALIVLASVSRGQDHLKTGVYALAGSISLGTDTERQIMPSPSGPSELVIQGTHFTFGPEASLFVVDNLEFNFSVTYASSISSIKKIPPAMSISSSNYFAWFLFIGTRFYRPLTVSEALYVGVGGGASWTKSAATFSAATFSKPDWRYHLDAGINILIEQHVALEPGIRYSYSEFRDYLDSHDLSFLVGVKYFLY